jgi:hypothetical protein
MHVSKNYERGKNKKKQQKTNKQNKTKKKQKKKQKRSLFFSSINHSVIFLISTNPDAVK